MKILKSRHLHGSATDVATIGTLLGTATTTIAAFYAEVESSLQTMVDAFSDETATQAL